VVAFHAPEDVSIGATALNCMIFVNVAAGIFCVDPDFVAETTTGAPNMLESAFDVETARFDAKSQLLWPLEAA
jgi:hypothetical protein